VAASLINADTGAAFADGCGQRVQAARALARRPLFAWWTPSTKATPSHEREQVRAIEASPSRLRHVEELVGHQEALRA
jgi:hypothetical protein